MSPPRSGKARAMILAAGLGTRLRPITEHTPKPLVPLAGHPLIAYGLGLLRANGIEDVVVNVHHLRDQVMTKLGDGSRYGVRIHYSIEEHLLDTGGGIRHAAELLDDGPVVVLNGDVVSEVPLADVLHRHEHTGALVTLVLRDDPQAARYGLFAIDASSRIRRFLGEGDSSPDLPQYMFASVQVIAPELVARMPQDRPFGTMREFYPALFRAGAPLFGYVYEGRWYTADTRADLAAADKALSGEGSPAYMRDLPLATRSSTSG
jgi:NDP-sugar pyrophosphorylase family protein